MQPGEMSSETLGTQEFDLVNWRPRSLTGRMAALASVAGALAVISAPIAYGMFGGSGILAVGIACVCCLLPGCVLFVLACQWTSGPAQLNLMMGGMAMRAASCLFAVLVMDGSLRLAKENYLIWLSVFYLAMLAVETWLLMHNEKASDKKLSRSTPVERQTASAPQAGDS